jgi:glycosyltransferase involved in cell wall biosynthesis
MKLIALSMVKNEEYWIWYALSSVFPFVDEILLFDNFSEDRTVEVVQGMGHIDSKLTLFSEFGGSSEQENRERCLEEARARGGSHVLFLDGDEVHNEVDLGFARRLLEVSEHQPALSDPPHNPGIPLNHAPTDGVLIKNIGFKPIHPGFEGPRTSIPLDHTQPDTDHGCYNFAIRIASLENLHGNGEEWGRHGYLETGDIYIQSSAQTLWCPGLHYYHFTHHPRSPLRIAGEGNWIRPVRDFGSVGPKPNARVPEALFDPRGPGNPTLKSWGLT